MSKNKDTELLERILARDERVIAELREEFLPMIKYMVSNYKYSDGTNVAYGNEQDVEDILHDTFYVIIKKIFDGELILKSKLSTYFYAVSKNLLKLKLRQRLHDKKYRNYNKDDIQTELSDDFFDENLKKKAFDYYFDKLSEVCKKILQLYWLDYSVKAISEKLGNTENYIKKRKYECKNRLIKLIKENNDNF